MENTMTPNGSVNHGWFGFAVKFVLAIVYYSACIGADQYLVHWPDTTLIFKLVACAVVLVPLMMWMVSAAVSRKRLDEYQRRLSDRALAWAAQWAILFSVLMAAAHLLVAAIQAPSIMTLPGLYFMASVLMGQIIKFRRIED